MDGQFVHEPGNDEAKCLLRGYVRTQRITVACAMAAVLVGLLVDIAGVMSAWPFWGAALIGVAIQGINWLRLAPAFRSGRVVKIPSFLLAIWQSDPRINDRDFTAQEKEILFYRLAIAVRAHGLSHRLYVNLPTGRELAIMELREVIDSETGRMLEERQ